jgi:hypothetical protein
MLFAVSGLVFLLFVTVSVASIREVRARIRHRAAEMNRAAVSWHEALTLGNGLMAQGELETLEAASFSKSLLRVIGAHSEASGGSSQAEVAVGALAHDSRD